MPGDIVLLKEQDLGRRTWPLARILSTHPGSDGLTRVAGFRCAGQTYRRPIHKLVLLVPKEERPASSRGGGGGECVRASDVFTKED